MDEPTKREITRLLQSKRTRASYIRMFAFVAALLALVVTMGLRQNGVAATHEEQVLDCHYAGIAAHTHNADCYDADGNLVCTLPERELHTHTDECYTETRELTCGLEESDGHHHTDDCYDAEGNLICGETESEGHHHTDACYKVTRELTCGKEEVTETHTHGPGCFKTIEVPDATNDTTVTDDATADDAQDVDEKPAQEFSGSLKKIKENGEEQVVLVVAVKAPKGAFPAGTTMKVDGVDPNKIEDVITKAVQKADKDATILNWFMGVDIKFFDPQGFEIQPEKKVEIKITHNRIRDIEEPILARTLDAEAKAKYNKKDDAEVLDQVILANQVDDDKSTGNENTFKFKTKLATTYVLVESQYKEEHVPAPVVTEAEVDAMPPQNFSETFTSAGAAGDVTVTVEAPSGSLPEGAILKIDEIAEGTDAYTNYLAQAAETAEGKDVALASFLDLTFVKDGKEIQPMKPVKVEITLENAPTEEAAAAVLHMGNKAQSVSADEKAGTVTFEAERFSVYGVIYTVEAHAEVTEPEIEAEPVTFEGEAGGIQVTVEADGGTFPLDTEMTVEAVGAKNVKRAIKHAVEGSVNEVAAVDITFRDAQGNDVQPLKPVKVTMTRSGEAGYGDQSVVHVDGKGTASVVDAAEADGTSVTFEADSFSVYAMVLTTQHISATGESYDVTVTYDAAASIPEGARLVVTEFEKDSEEWEGARKAVLADKLAKGESVDLDSFGFAALDISIMVGDEEIEPESEVQVDLKVKGLPEVEDLGEVAASIEVQHHVETVDGVIVETVAGGEAEASFAQATDTDVIADGGRDAVDPESVNEALATAESPAEEDYVETSFDVEVFSTYTISYNYNRNSKRIHYVDTAGNSLTPTMTPNFDNRYQFLIYDIDGYEYDSTHIGSRGGTEIQPILRGSNNNGLYYSGNIEYRSGNNWSTLSNNNIYVVYKPKTTPTTGGTPQIDQTETWPDQEDPARKPQFGKSSTNNGNGTNNISLTITGPEKPVEKSTPADVIVVFDISGSMKTNDMSGTRLDAAKTATNNMANTLLNGSNHDVRMALITFSTTASQVNITGATDGFTSNYNNFRNAVNGLSADGGTNWEQALKLANQMEVRSDAATFVVFVTDGDPTFRMSRGNVSDGSLLSARPEGSNQTRSDMFVDNGDYYYYRNNKVFGDGNNDYFGRNLSFAVNQVKAIAGANKNFYAIGISNQVTKVQNLTTQGGVPADHAFIASNNTAMQNAFKSITESIKSKLGFGNLEVTDGITALTNAEMKVMQTVDPSSFRYYRYGGENNKYGNGYANKTEWTSRAADGCAPATYTESDGAVHWDMGEDFQLEDGVTYVVEFTVWPSQAAYDLVADLNNGLKTFASLTDAEKAQVVEVTAPTSTTTGTYALKTNTDEIEATYNRTSKIGETVTISDTTKIEAEYHEGTLEDMSLDSDYITVKKEWHNALDSRVVDGITLTVTKDGTAYLDDVALSDSNSWTSDEQYISAGFITHAANSTTVYNVRETGHDYTVTEPPAFSYYWDLTADTYRPMVIDGTLAMLIKTDIPTGVEGTDYYVIRGKSYQVSSTTTTPQLTASNDRRSNLNLKKVVTADTQAADKVPNPDDVFTYTITVTDANGDAVWFSAMDESGATVLIDTHSANVTPEVDTSANPTGSYSVPSGAQFTISIKAGWNVRFFNLPKGTTYSIQETGMADGYEFVKAETSAEVTKPEYADDFKATPGTVSGDTVTGTIDQPNNVYSTEYTNNWNPDNEIVIVKTDENGTKLAGATFKLSKQAGEEWAEIATFTSKASAGETLKVGHGLYKLEETAAPSNYMTRSEAKTVYFEVETSGSTTTVTLTDDKGEDKTYVDVTASGNEVTVKNWPLTSANALKAWRNADGTKTAPQGGKVTFTLYIDGEASGYTVELDGTADTVPTGTDPAGYESEGWKATFANLPKYQADGTTEVVYTIAETGTWPGYTASTTDPVASGGTITNSQDPTEAYALKAWKNADGSTTPPEGGKVTFTLYADGTATGYTVTLDGTADTAPSGTGGYESEAWKAEFVNLPKYQAGTTTEIVYTIAETGTWPGYTASTTDTVASGETITNEQGSTETFALKAWRNADGSTTAPEGGKVTFTLYADGEATEYAVELDGTANEAPAGAGGYESEAWKAEFVNLPKSKVVDGEAVDIIYAIAETTTWPGYTASTTDPVASGSTIINSQDPTEAYATKAWKNADDTTTAPQGGKVTFTLYADGEATEYTVELDGTADTAPEATGGYESEAWKATFANLPKYKLVEGETEGEVKTVEIVYTIAETTTWPGYNASTTDPVESGGTITNTQEPTEANALKEWKNADGTTTPPEGATVEFTLYADGTATEYKVTLDGTADEDVPTGTAGYESEAWKAQFVNLPKYKVVDGEAVEIVYTVVESVTYPGYAVSPNEPVASGEIITNEQEDVDVYAMKEWENADGSTTPPEGATVEFTLYADGTATEYKVTLDGNTDTAPEATGGYEGQPWRADFVNLPKYKIVDGEAVDIVYTIGETGKYQDYELVIPEGAATPYTVASGDTITNRQSTLWVRFKKTDMDGNGLSGAKFTLSDDGTGKAITLTSGNNGVMAAATTDDQAAVDKFKLAIRDDKYILTETKAPAGYNMLTEPVEVSVQSAGVTWYEGDDLKNAQGDGSEGNPYVVLVHNSSGVELPHSGGVGTQLFLAIGAGMMAAGALVLAHRRRGMIAL